MRGSNVNYRHAQSKIVNTSESGLNSTFTSTSHLQHLYKAQDSTYQTTGCFAELLLIQVCVMDANPLAVQALASAFWYLLPCFVVGNYGLRAKRTRRSACALWKLSLCMWLHIFEQFRSSTFGSDKILCAAKACGQSYAYLCGENRS